MTGRARHAEVAGKSLPRGPGRGGLGVLPRPELGSEGRSDAVGGWRRGIGWPRTSRDRSEPQVCESRARAAPCGAATLTGSRARRHSHRHLHVSSRGAGRPAASPAPSLSVEGPGLAVRCAGGAGTGPAAWPALAEPSPHPRPSVPRGPAPPHPAGGRAPEWGSPGETRPHRSLPDLTPRASNPEGVHAPQRVPET